MATPTSLPAAFTAGQVLTASQANNLRGAFRILQVVDATLTTQVASFSGTYTDIGLSASITPQSSTSKILVLLSQNTYADSPATGVGIQILRNATVLTTTIQCSFGTGSGNVAQNFFTYLDSPSTTSTTTYKVQMNRTAGAGGAYTQINNNPSRIILFEVSA